MLRRALVTLADSRPDAGCVDRGAAVAPAAPTVAVLLLVHYTAAHVSWGLSRLVLGVRGLGRVPGLRFARVLGSGHHGGFGLRPSLDRQGLMAFFDDEAAAEGFVDRSDAVAARRRRADELLIAILRATSCRGSWSGAALAPSAVAAPGQPIASLTRAAIRLPHAASFWRHSPPAEHSLQAAPGCRLAVGLGEAPLLRQATFSLWDDTAAMEAWARGGAHRKAADGAWREDWFDEWMFARFVATRLEGRWHDRTFG
jgi:hypothetical protein